MRPKRRVARNIHGNLIGYEGRHWVEMITGCGRDPYSEAEDKAAHAWVAGREDWQDAAWED